jgi:Uma2 family endonuclease
MRFDMAPLPFARSGKKFSIRSHEMKDIALPASGSPCRKRSGLPCAMFIMAQRNGLEARVREPSLLPSLSEDLCAKIGNTIWDEEELKMSLPQQQPLFVPDEYLAFERDSEERHEWLDGLIYAMAGESIAHNTICANLAITVGTQLKGKSCRVLSPNMKVYSRLPTDPKLKGLFAYPDVTVVCGKPILHDKHQDVLINPRVIIEVLSNSTERYDRSEKFVRYRQNASLTDYMLVSQFTPSVELFSRRADGRWLYSFEMSLAGSLAIATIECE